MTDEHKALVEALENRPMISRDKKAARAIRELSAEVAELARGDLRCAEQMQMEAQDALNAANAEIKRLKPQGKECKMTDVRESDGDLLARLGADGQKWAQEFRKKALALGYSDMDEEWLICWFANAIMAGWDHGRRQLAATVAREAGTLLWSDFQDLGKENHHD